MDYEAILLDVKDQVATITLNRPERLNAWNEQMSGELGDALAACNDNDDVRAVVLTGAGRAFCAGADLGGGGATFSGPEQREDRTLEGRIQPWQLDKPVIAAINGHAIGVGMSYPMLCDIRYVAEDAKIQFAFVRRGIVPELASPLTVARVAGLSNAAELLLSGRMILGSEAVALGLATKALPAEEVLPAAQECARDIAINAAPASVAITKRLLWEGISASIPQMQEREGRLLAWAGNQPDAHEGVVSFLEKRPPKWNLSIPKDKPDIL